MEGAKQNGLVAMGPAHRLTRAIGDGQHMELTSPLYYDKPGSPALLGSARALTRAVADGTRAELNSVFRWSPGPVEA